jgi:hypothetical protein
VKLRNLASPTWSPSQNSAPAHSIDERYHAGPSTGGRKPASATAGHGRARLGGWRPQIVSSEIDGPDEKSSSSTGY